MTKKEFIELINSLDETLIENRDEDMLYFIGSKHKEVDLGSRNWTELNQLLNYPFKDGESYRCWVKSKAASRGELKENPCVIKTGKTVSQMEKEELEKAFEEKQRDLYKQQVKTRDIVNEYRKTIREQGRFEVLCEELIKSMAEMKPVVLSKVPSYGITEGAEAVLAIGDIHYGSVVDNFYNKYNTDIARQRLDFLANETIKYCEKFGIKKLTVVNLADSIEGSIHVTARITNELQTCGQIIGVTELLAQVLGKLANHIPYIVYRSCIGNHDRAIQNYKESLPIDNFSEIIDWGLQMRLQLSGFSNIDFVFDNLSESFGVFSLENGKKVGFSHGDTISLDQAYQSFCGATKSHIDYIILSHFHCAKSKEFNGAKVYVNGSVKGTDTYALSKNLFSKPSQTLLIFDGDNDLDFRINF